MSVNENDVLLKVEHLCMYFGPKKAVNDVSFDIHRGEVFGLVGESGCGKTTTGRTIIKLYDATSGNVYFKGRRIVAGTKSYKDEIKKLRAKKKQSKDQNEIAECNERIAELKKEIELAKHDQKNCDKDYRKDMAAAGTPVRKGERLVTKIQMIYQDPVASLDPRMTVEEIISEGLKIQGIKDKKYIREHVIEMLETVGLVREHATRYPHEFSGGQRQRIGIARSIIMKPEMIIADEPISALDVSIRAQVLNLLKKFQQERGLTYLFIAHDLSIVRFISDRIVVIYKGRIMEIAETEELFHYPLHPYTKSLMSAIPVPDPIIEKRKKLFVYDPSMHDYENEKPELVDIGNGHFVFGSQSEIEKYKAVRFGRNDK